MAKTDPKDFQKTAATGVNSDVFDINIDEGALTAAMNDALRGLGGVLAAPCDFGDAADAILIDHIVESTPDAGVTIDELQIKDGGLEGAVSLDAVTATGSLTMDGSAIDGALGVAVASAATTDIWVTDGNTVHITGVEVITSLGTAAQAGATRSLVFDDAATLTNGANLILPGGTDIVTAAGDCMDVLAESTTTARATSYTKADGTAVAAPGSGILWVRDERTAGTDGGSSSVGAQTRVLNTVKLNTIPGASLSANEITLPAGITVRITAHAPCQQGGDHKCWLEEVGVGAIGVDGTSEYNGFSGAFAQTSSWISGQPYVVAAPLTFTLEHYISNAFGTAGLGGASASGRPEVYAEVIIEVIG